MRFGAAVRPAAGQVSWWNKLTFGAGVDADGLPTAVITAIKPVPLTGVEVGNLYRSLVASPSSVAMSIRSSSYRLGRAQVNPGHHTWDDVHVGTQLLRLNGA